VFWAKTQIASNCLAAAGARLAPITCLCRNIALTAGEAFAAANRAVAPLRPVVDDTINGTCELGAGTRLTDWPARQAAVSAVDVHVPVAVLLCGCVTLAARLRTSLPYAPRAHYAVERTRMTVANLAVADKRARRTANKVPIPPFPRHLARAPLQGGTTRPRARRPCGPGRHKAVDGTRTKIAGAGFTQCSAGLSNRVRRCVNSARACPFANAARHTTLTKGGPRRRHTIRRTRVIVA
jgi:hypothetical protein